MVNPLPDRVWAVWSNRHADSAPFQPLVFDTLEAALAAKERLTRENPNELFWTREFSPADYIEWRERSRLGLGQYKPTPWGDLPPIPGHSLHRSTETAGLVAYTPDERYGLADRQISIRPGRYLQRFYPYLDNDQVAELAAQVTEDHAGDLHFAATEDEIETVYTEGPNSCMAHPAREYNNDDYHPVRCYAAGDLQVAFLRRHGKITARAVCWPAKKIFARIYGDDTRLRLALRARNFSLQTGGNDFEGARLILRYDDKGIVMPYVDFAPPTFVCDGKFLVATHGGPIGGQNSDHFGYAYGDGNNDEDTFVCSCCNETYCDDDATRVHPDRLYCPRCVARNTFLCDRCETCYDNEDNGYVSIKNTGAVWCERCVSRSRSVSQCERCEEHYLDTPMQTDRDQEICPDCYDDDHETETDDETEAHTEQQEATNVV